MDSLEEIPMLSILKKSENKSHLKKFQNLL